MRAALSAAGLGCALAPYRLGFEPLGGEFSAGRMCALMCT